MNKIIITLFVLFAWINTKAKVIELSWQKNAIVTDGSNDDWMERPSYSDNESGVLYEAYNDSDNLYLMFEIISGTTQLKAMSSGFNIWFTVKAKPKVNAVIFMPVIEGAKSNGEKRPINSDNSFNRDANNKGKSKKTVLSRDYKLKTSSTQVLYFIDNPDVIYSTETIDGFAYNTGWDRMGSMLIEFRIPLYHLFGDNFVLNEISNSKLIIKPEFKGIEKPENTSEGADMSRGGGPSSGGGPGGVGPGGVGPGGVGPGGVGPGGGGPSGGGMQSGSRSNSGNSEGISEMKKMSTTNSFKYTVTLSTNQ